MDSLGSIVSLQHLHRLIAMNHGIALPTSLKHLVMSSIDLIDSGYIQISRYFTIRFPNKVYTTRHFPWPNFKFILVKNAACNVQPENTVYEENRNLPYCTNKLYYQLPRSHTIRYSLWAIIR